MAKSALLIKMIELMRCHPGITITELACSTGRSERTVYRWLNELSVDLRTPTQFLDGGYYLLEHPDPKSIELAPEELLAIRMGLKSAPFGDGSPLKAHAESAWLKVRNAITWQKMDAARDLAISHSMDVKMSVSDVSSEIIEILEAGVKNHMRLRVLYRSQKSNEIKPYLVDPYAIVFRKHSWYLLAFSPEHETVIQMKLARFQAVAETGASFEAPVGFSVEEHFRYSWEAWSGGEPTQVRVLFSPRVAKMISEGKRHPTQVVRKQADGSVIFEAEVAGIEEIAIWVLGYGKEAEVLEPESLRAHVLDHITGAAENYHRSVEKNNFSQLAQ